MTPRRSQTLKNVLLTWIFVILDFCELSVICDGLRWLDGLLTGDIWTPLEDPWLSSTWKKKLVHKKYKCCIVSLSKLFKNIWDSVCYLVPKSNQIGLTDSVWLGNNFFIDLNSIKYCIKRLEYCQKAALYCIQYRLYINDKNMINYMFWIV